MARPAKLFNHRRRKRAQGMVEFALALPIFLLLVLGIIEFARLMLTYSAVYSASREAARYAVAVGLGERGVPNYQDCVGIKSNGVRVGSFGGVQAEDIEIRYDDGLREIPLDWDTLARCNGDVDKDRKIKLGDRVLVQVTTRFEPIVPLVNLPGFDVSSTTARTFLTAVDVRGTPLPTSTRVHTYTPTKTNTPPNTPTETSSPTATLAPSETFTNTPGPSPTDTETPLPSDTPTITPTPTASDIPTDTPTPTATFTATITSTPSANCALISTRNNQVVYGPNWVEVPIRNDLKETIFTRSIQVIWMKESIQLNEVRYGTYFWEGEATSPWSTSFSIPNTGPSIASNSEVNVRLFFTGTFGGETETPYFEMAFENNCLLRWPGALPTATPQPPAAP